MVTAATKTDQGNLGAIEGRGGGNVIIAGLGAYRSKREPDPIGDSGTHEIRPRCGREAGVLCGVGIEDHVLESTAGTSGVQGWLSRAVVGIASVGSVGVEIIEAIVPANRGGGSHRGGRDHWDRRRCWVVYA